MGIAKKNVVYIIKLNSWSIFAFIHLYAFTISKFD